MVGSLWKWIVGAIVLIAVLAVGAYFGLEMYIAHRNQQWLAEADAAYDSGDWQLAKNYFERYIPQDKDNVELLLRYADACQRVLNGRVAALQGAATAYQQVLTLDPDNREIREKLLRLYKKMGAWGNLEYYTEEWLSSHPDDPELRYDHALALDRLGRRDEAIEEYRMLAEANTDYSQAYADYARLLHDRGLDIEAEKVLRDAVERRPNDAQVRIDYARFLARKRDWDQVDALLQEAITMAPDNPDVLIAQAQAAGLRENYDQVIECLRKATIVDPDNATAHLMLAGAYVAMDDVPSAVDTLRDVDPIVQVDNPSILITLGDLQLSLRQFDEAHATLQRYTNAYSEQLPVNEYFAAKELLVKGSPRDAIKKLATVVELRPNFLQAQYTLAVAYIDAGDMELARNALDAYLDKNPSDVRARDLLLRNFGEPISYEDTVARANETLDNADAGAEALYAAGFALFEMSRRSGALESNQDTIRRLLRRSIEKAPRKANAYRTLVELELSDGQIRNASSIVDEATQAGVPESDLAKPRVAIALASGDNDKAHEIVSESFADTAVPAVETYIEWGQFLASHGAYDEAASVLDEGASKIPGEDAKNKLALVRISLDTRRGNIDDAIKRLQELDAQVPLDSPQRHEFNAARLEVVQYLLGSDSGEGGDRVVSLADAVRKEEPDNSVLKTIDGFLLLRKDPPDVDQAKTLFESAAAASPRDVNAFWGLARVASLEQDYPRALVFAERAAALAPDVPALQLQLGEILSALGRRLEAEKALKQVLKDEPQNLRALQLLIGSLIDRKQIRQARELLAQLERDNGLDPADAAAVRSLRGRLLMSQGDNVEAEQLLREQYANDPDNIDLARNLARTMLNQGRSEEAVRFLGEFAQKHASRPEGWVALARLYTTEGGDANLARASTALTRALVADPHFAPALRDMLGVRIKQGNLGEAIGLCDRYLEKSPDSPDILNTKALLLADTRGQLDAAETTIERAIALDNQPEYVATRGMILLRKGESRRALEDLQSAAANMSSTTATIDLALAEAYLAEGDPSSAQRYYNSAVRKSDQGEPVDRSRLTRVGQMLEKQGAAA